MNKYIKITLIGIVIFLFFTFSFFFKNNSDNYEDKILIINSDLNNNSKLDNNSNLDIKNLTYEEVLMEGNILNCDYLSNSMMIENCKLSLIKCSDDECYSKKAKFEGNEKLCFNIKDETLRIECSASIKISNIIKRSVIEDNISICLEFNDKEGINHCQDNYYYVKSYNLNNKSYCDKILNLKVKNECFK